MVAETCPSHRHDDDLEKEKLETTQIEKVLTPDELLLLQKDMQDYNRIDVSLPSPDHHSTPTQH